MNKKMNNRKHIIVIIDNITSIIIGTRIHI